MTIIRTQVCKLPITVFAFETQESLGLLALRLTFLTAHWWQQISLSKMFRTPCQIMIVCCTCNRSRNYKAMADFEAFYQIGHGRFRSILPPQKWQQISLSKMFHIPCQKMTIFCTSNRSRNYKAMADFEAFYQATGKNDNCKSLHRERVRWVHSS